MQLDDIIVLIDEIGRINLYCHISLIKSQEVMNITERSSVELLDLPDEILLMIFKKLNNTFLLYCLSDINKRLNRIIYDRILTHRISLLYLISSRMIKRPYMGMPLVRSLPCQILDRYCAHILPKINDKIQRFDFEPSSIERILSTTYYPNLREIYLYDFHEDTAKNLFSSKIFCFSLSFYSTFHNEMLYQFESLV